MTNNVISLAEQTNEKALEIAISSLARKFGTTADKFLDVALELTSRDMADIGNGYILYNCEGVTRAAMVINAEINGLKFPFIIHTDYEGFNPEGPLLAEMEYEFLGQFVDYVFRDENMALYGAMVVLIPEDMGGIGAIQVIHNAKIAKVSASDEIGLRRIIKQTIKQLQSS